MNRNSRNRSPAAGGLLILLVGALLGAKLASGQFIPASSHLGRLVQSITSPLVLTSGSYRETADADPAPGYPSGPSDYPAHHMGGLSSAAGSYADYGPSEGLIRPEASRPERQTGYYRPMPMPSLQLQQSPSQVRGMQPHQQYYQQQQLHLAQAQAAHAASQQQQQQQQQQKQPQMYRQAAGGYHQQAAASYQQQDQASDDQDSRDRGERAGGFSMHGNGPDRSRNSAQHHYRANDQGASPSNNQNNKHKGAEPELGYQMGAELGPIIDDKEIQGAFNSNDDRDDDDSPNAFPSNEGAAGFGRHNKAASNAFASNQADYPPETNSEYSPDSESSAGPYSPYSASGQQQGRPQSSSSSSSSSYDDDSADEDDAPVARPRQGAAGRGRSGQLTRSASQARQRGSSNNYHQQQQQQRRGQRGDSGSTNEDSGLGAQGNTGMMAAANGYAPFGYANGPVDLTGLMNAGYQVYGGDGSLGPYGPAGYGAQYGPNAGNNGRGGNNNGRNQAAASESYDGFDSTRDGYQAKNNNDNDDNDPDDD